MKVTKLIREYVEVSKLYDAKVNPYSEQAEIDTQMIKDFENALVELKHNAVKDFLLHNKVFSSWDGTPIIASSNPSFHRWRTQSMLDKENWKKENTNRKNAKIREIMVSLELGANRQELNDMIAQLMEE